jgi:hypothetical protein
MNGFLTFPRKFDADWLNSIVILSAFAYENYYGIPGLAHSVITDEYYDVAKKPMIVNLLIQRISHRTCIN